MSQTTSCRADSTSVGVCALRIAYSDYTIIGVRLDSWALSRRLCSSNSCGFLLKGSAQCALLSLIPPAHVFVAEDYTYRLGGTCFPILADPRRASLIRVAPGVHRRRYLSSQFPHRGFTLCIRNHSSFSRRFTRAVFYRPNHVPDYRRT